MGAKSRIEWTDATWNPVTGCTKVSEGCRHCYAEVFAERWRGIPGHHYEQGFDLRIWPERLGLPLRWQKPRMIFVNSMSDLFHERIAPGFILSVFATMRRAHWHTFQVLTKRADRLAALSPSIEWPPNVWMGVSVENQETADARIPPLLVTPAAVRFVSAEPLLGEITLREVQSPEFACEIDTLTGDHGVRRPLVGRSDRKLHWVIAGGESGPQARAVDPDWIRSLRDQCAEAGTPFFFKQWGGTRKKEAGRTLDGRTWDEMPVGAA